MFHIRSNFRKGGPISQVPSSWFNQVADFLNNLVAGYGLKLNKSLAGPSIVELDANVIAPTSRDPGKPTDKTDDSPDDYQDTEPWKWTAGGENGLKIDAYCKVENLDGWHYLSRCRLTISKDGLITKVEGLEGQKEIQA